MTLDKTRIWIFAAGLILGLCIGFFVGKGIYDQPIDESVTHDTIRVSDTIPDYNPTPKDSATIRWVTKWLPKAVHDTLDHFVEVSKFVHDTVAVEVPITSKHYGDSTYDAWVSGFEPRLDSIKVYREKEIITTTIVKEKGKSKFSLNVDAGVDYLTKQDKLSPYVVGDFNYNIKKSRFSIGARGGVMKTDKVEPLIDGYMRIKIF